MKQTPKQTASAVFETIKEIRSKRKTGREPDEHGDKKAGGFTDAITRDFNNAVINEVCSKNNISEPHIREVAGWKTISI